MPHVKIETHSLPSFSLSERLNHRDGPVTAHNP
ncbi:hypothetical protein HDA40_005799 [Hamadaea flava]|nr:hypothetical protein [Hamadaea flava]